MGGSFVISVLLQVSLVGTHPESGASGLVFSDSPNSLIALPVEPAPLPKLQDVLISQGAIAAPALWGQQLVGFDLVQMDFSTEELSPVTVYVADAGVARGAARKIETSGAPYKRRKIALRAFAGISNPTLRGIMKRFAPRLKVEINDPTDPVPPHHPTHGTHVAGLIGSGFTELGGGRTNTVVDLDIFKGVGIYRYENLVEGLNKITNENIPNSIINLSVETSTQVETAIALQELAEQTDTVVVIASGNSGLRLPPQAVASRFEDGLVVGALGLSGVRANFSNYGDAVDLVAPGEQIISRGAGIEWNPESLEVMTGTSFAAPIVSGSASIVRSILPQASRSVVNSILTRTAIDLGLRGRDFEYGHGLVNAYRAAIVAQRLSKLEQKSPESLAEALKEGSVFNTQEPMREAILEQNKAGFGTSAFEENLRRAALLDGSSAGLEKLGAYQVVQSNALFGMGLMLAHYNQEDFNGSCEDLESAAKLVWMLQKVRAVSYRDLSILRGLTNKDLLFSTYSAMTPDLQPLTPIFEERMLEIAPLELDSFLALVAERTQNSLESGQAVAVNTAP